MKVYVDCDVAVKLAKWGLLSRFSNLLTKQGRAELYTVSTLKYRFKLAQPDKALALLGSNQAVVQLVGFVNLARSAKGVNQQVAKSLANVAGIDPGEAALFSAAAQFDGVLVDTGDKNALRALGALGPGDVAVQTLQGKLACLEQTLDYLIERWSFEVVSTAVASCTDADASSTACIHGRTGEAARLALSDKIEALFATCGPILAPKPFSWV